MQLHRAITIHFNKQSYLALTLVTGLIKEKLVQYISGFLSERNDGSRENHIGPTLSVTERVVFITLRVVT